MCCAGRKLVCPRLVYSRAMFLAKHRAMREENKGGAQSLNQLRILKASSTKSYSQQLHRHSEKMGENSHTLPLTRPPTLARAPERAFLFRSPCTLSSFLGPYYAVFTLRKHKQKHKTFPLCPFLLYPFAMRKRKRQHKKEKERPKKGDGLKGRVSHLFFLSFSLSPCASAEAEGEEGLRDRPVYLRGAPDAGPPTSLTSLSRFAAIAFLPFGLEKEKAKRHTHLA